MNWLIIIILVLAILYIISRSDEEIDKLFERPKTFTRNIIRYLKHHFQRWQRGYSDEYSQNIDLWFLEVMPSMLRHLAENTHSFPDDCKNYEQWRRELWKMAKHIETYCLFDKNNQSPSDQQFPSVVDQKKIRQYIAQSKRAQNETKKGLHQFANRFFDLYD